jgi:hypothetical protein
MTGHLLNVQCLQVSYSFFFDANALKLVVTFLAPLVLLIERNNVGSEQVQVH